MQEQTGQKLRKIAEDRLDWTKINTIQDEELKKAIHELNVYQIELEVQNDELNRTQKTLEETRDQYQYLYDFAPVGYCTIDKEGTIITMNLTFASMMDISRKDGIQRSFYNIIDYEEKDIFYLYLRKLFLDEDTGKKTSVTLHIHTQRGDTLCVQLESMLVQNKRYVYTAIIDITEKKKIEDALHESEMQKSLVLNAINELFGYYTTDLEIIWLNKAALHSIDKTPEASQGKHCYELWTGLTEPCPDCPVLKSLKTRKPEEIEKQTPDGRYWLVRGYPILDETGEISNLCELTMDITPLKKAEHELREMHKQLKQTNQHLEDVVKQRTEALERTIQLKDDFINQLGHDLKNPLGPLINLLPLLEKKALDERDKEIFKVLSRNVNYMKNLVTKTLELARLNSPNTTLSTEPLPLKQYLEEILQNNMMLFEKKHMRVKTTIPDDLMILGDRLLLEELFNNIINNAVKYSNDHATVTITADQQDEMITLAIQDTGIGLNKNQQERLFDEFYKADPARHDFDSSGLGLPICKRIIEKHGGKIWVESPGLEKGSTFYVTLPKN
ncbi:MAG: PAS domain-containing sensor histidine kinase [Candidatus Thermoplasmatota archaeon]|nr:PAS domain-containing sensor histidine kinase [Candidatus Thermoplasmatota archaeon]